MDIISWLSENKTLNHTDGRAICSSAAEGGHIHILEHCKEMGYEWDEQVCRMAAFSGKINVIQWGMVNGQIVSRCPSIMTWASIHGRIDTMDWLMANSFEHDYTLCNMAARRGCVDILRWARGNGIQFDVNTWLSAEKVNNMEILEYLRESGCPGSFL